MLINADFSRSALVTPEEYQWIASPQGGVERMMLDRIGAEKARATSIVRYVPGSHFPLHTHHGGEEIFVLSGVFSEDDRHYPAGWYLRNPPGSSHQPFTIEGAIIFVKLRQMSSDDNQTVRVDTRPVSAWHRSGRREVCPLYSFGTEVVSLQRLSPGEPLIDDSLKSAEVLVLTGSLITNGHVCRRGTWVRLPAGASSDLFAGKAGASIYLKTGHLNGLSSKD